LNTGWQSVVSEGQAHEGISVQSTLPSYEGVENNQSSSIQEKSNERKAKEKQRKGQKKTTCV